MPFSDKRMYRNFAASNFNAVMERESEDSPESYVVRGYFTTFDEPYVLFEDVNEVIDPHAFDECDMSDVIMQVNHDGFVYARTRNNSLRITFDEHGGMCEADLTGSKRGREELYEAITNGLIDRMSFGFIIADDGFEWDDKTRTSRITKISKLFDVSAIAGFPANPGTEIHARDYLNGVIEAGKQQEMLQRAAQQAELERRRRAAMALELVRLR